MDQALEFLSGPRVLVLRLYDQPVRTEITGAIHNVTRHGCYRPGVPLLLDVTQIESLELAGDLYLLRVALTSAMPDSPLAVVVPVAGVSDEAPWDRTVFTSRSDALNWLAPPVG